MTESQENRQLQEQEFKMVAKIIKLTFESSVNAIFTQQGIQTAKYNF